MPRTSRASRRRRRAVKTRSARRVRITRRSRRRRAMSMSIRASAIRTRLRPRAARSLWRSRRRSGSISPRPRSRSSKRPTPTSRSRLVPAERVSARMIRRPRFTRRPCGLRARRGRATRSRRPATRIWWMASSSPASARGSWRKSARMCSLSTGVARSTMVVGTAVKSRRGAGYTTFARPNSSPCRGRVMPARFTM